MNLTDAVRKMHAAGLKVEIRYFEDNGGLSIFGRIPPHRHIDGNTEYDRQTTDICVNLVGGKVPRAHNAAYLDAQIAACGELREYHKHMADNARWIADYRDKKAIRDWTLVEPCTELHAS